jgi:hypothetical protein
MAEQVVTKDVLMKRILQLENAGDADNAQLVRDILNRDYPNAQAEMGDPALEPYPYTDEQLEMDLQNKEARKLGNAEFADSERTRMNEHLLSENMGGAVAGSYLSGAMFVGEYVDEAVGAVMGEDKMEQQRRLQMAFEEEYPKTNIALRVAGGVTSAAPIAMMGTTQKLYKFAQGLPFLQKYLMMAGMGASFGVTEGAVSGAGIQGKDETGGTQTRGENMFDLGISGSLWGGLGQIGGQALSDVGALAWVRIKDGLKNSTNAEIKELFSLTSDKTVDIIKATVSSTSAGINTMIEKLRLGGSQGQIPDADDAISSLLDLIVITGGEGGSTVVQKVGGRAQTVAAGVDSSLNRNIANLPKDKDGLSGDATMIAKELAQSTAPARTKAYTKAYNQKINYAGSDGKAINDVLALIPPDIKKEAIKKANNMLIMKGMPLGQNGFDIAEDGVTIVMKNNPNMLQLDYIKRALGELAYGSPDIMKKSGLKVSGDAMMYNSLRAKLNNVLKSIGKPKNGESAYSQATRLGQDKITRQNALEIGGSILDPQVNRNTVSRIMADAGDAEKEMARLGLRGSIEDMLANVKATINSPNIDLNQMNTLLKTLSTDNVRGKLKILLGDQKAKSVFKTLEMAESALKLKATIAQGSQTASRGIAAGNVDEILNEGVINKMTNIQPVLAGQELLQKVLQAKTITGKRKNLIMKELANALLGTKGLAARKQYRELYDSVKRGEATEAQILKISELIASRLTIAPINFTQQVMQDTEIEDKAMLGVSNFLQR